MTGISTGKKKINRRDFFGVTWGIALLGLFGQAGLALFRFLRPVTGLGEFGGDVIAGNIDEFSPGTVSAIIKARCNIVRLEDGGVLAIWQRCTHLGCTVPWREEEGVFNCPCHSSLFSRVGEVLDGPAPRPLDLFPVRIEGSDLIIDTGTVLTRQEYDPSHVFYPDEVQE
jgi:cytochrome b6-f complex iron-sulfur subunit